MIPRIELDESVPDSPIAGLARGVPPPPISRQLLDADWEDPASDPLTLYVAEEPRIGDEFSYHGLRWQIVDYRNGWIAQLSVE
jgi:hypothetical protein